jgi:hypothetical protein
VIKYIDGLKPEIAISQFCGFLVNAIGMTDISRRVDGLIHHLNIDIIKGHIKT